MPKMKKYKGTENPKNYASHYLTMISPCNLSNENVAMLFGQTLEDSALECYHGVSTAVKKDWDLLVKAFVK